MNDVRHADLLSDFRFTTSDGAITITKYAGIDGEVAIPPVINGIPVARIGENAFSKCIHLISVIIPEEVTSICDFAFIDCTSLASVIIGSNVTNIGNFAFKNCRSLTTVAIPDRVISIGAVAFNDCTNLAFLTLGSSLESIGRFAFKDCACLSTVEIPMSVASIGDMAFEGCISLVSVILSSKGTILGDGVFQSCPNLRTVTIRDANIIDTIDTGGTIQKLQQWTGVDGEISRFISEKSARMVRAYQEDPSRIVEDYNKEREILAGGYGRRQLFELIQNAADAIKESGKPGLVEVVLDGETLYCANEGVPLDRSGAQALLMAHLSGKSGDQIGRFGLGFKSVIGISDAPEFFSRSGSLRFDPVQSEKQIRQVVPDCGNTPRLRIAQVIDPVVHALSDGRLLHMMFWASTVVRLPLRHESVANLTEDLRSFPAHFLIFAPCISELRIVDEISKKIRIIKVEQQGQHVLVAENEQSSSWRVFNDALPVSELRESARGEVEAILHGRSDLPVIWAVPCGASKRARGCFWAFFPTQSETTLSGILNAPWKTNSDRMNLQNGPYNQAIMAFAVQLIVRNIGKLVLSSKVWVSGFRHMG